MKNYAFLIIATAFLFTSNVNAQTGIPVTDATDAKAEILTALTLTHGATELNFGTIVMTAAASLTGTTVVNQSWDADQGSSTAYSQVGTPTTPAYDATGMASASFALTVADFNVLDGIGTGADMAVDTFTVSYDDATEGVITTASTFDVSGLSSFEIGATLHVGAGQENGSYSGTMNVIINYN
jgi:hypothetical protein